MTEIHRKWPGIFDEMVTRRIPINEFKAALNNPPPPGEKKSVVMIAA